MKLKILLATIFCSSITAASAHSECAKDPLAELMNVYTAEKAYFIEHQSYSPMLEDLGVEECQGLPVAISTWNDDFEVRVFHGKELWMVDSHQVISREGGPKEDFNKATPAKP